MRCLCLPALIGLLSGCAAFNYGDPLGPRYAGGRVVPPGGTLEGLTVVTFNVRYGEDVEGALAELVAAGLGDAAVVLLQEMDAEGAAAIADGLGMESSLRPRNPEAERVELCKGPLLNKSIDSRTDASCVASLHLLGIPPVCLVGAPRHTGA